MLLSHVCSFALNLHLIQKSIVFFVSEPVMFNEFFLQHSFQEIIYIAANRIVTITSLSCRALSYRITTALHSTAITSNFCDPVHQVRQVERNSISVLEASKKSCFKLQDNFTSGVDR